MFAVFFNLEIQNIYDKVEARGAQMISFLIQAFAGVFLLEFILRRKLHIKYSFRRKKPVNKLHRWIERIMSIGLYSYLHFNQSLTKCCSLSLRIFSFIPVYPLLWNINMNQKQKNTSLV